MNLMDIFTGIRDLGPRIVFYPKLKRLTGSNKSAILLCYLVGLYDDTADRQKDADGWARLDVKALEGQTGLTRTEQEAARKTLRGIEVLEEKRMGLPASTYFRMNDEVLDRMWDFLESSEHEAREKEGDI
ncbi:MAG: hypothetical protein PHG30_06340 [Eubacteriales bacterium]|jgi:hypothetical protein|nr:hypothetical protein [Eubacteriales bacterium]HQM83026.1 hypothetical protein [Syntrophorhabdaceae bacterium]